MADTYTYALTARAHLSTAEACRYLGCSRTTFWKVRKAGEIRPTGYIRGAARFSRRDLDELLRNGTPRELAGMLRKPKSV